jgi:hypothetical protein
MTGSLLTASEVAELLGVSEADEPGVLATELTEEG